MRLVFGIVPIVVFLALATNLCLHSGVQPDDSGYVALRVAENLRTGQGIIFNPGERRDLVDSPLWLGILSPLSFSSQAPLVMQAIGLALGVGALLLVLATPRLPITGACASLFLGMDGLFAARATSGSSALLAALYLLGLYLLLRGTRNRGAGPSAADWSLALWVSIAALVRYELVLVAVPAAVGWGLTDRKRLHAWLPLALGVGGAALWLGLRAHYFHAVPAFWEPWPPTGATERAGLRNLAGVVLHRPLLLMGVVAMLSSWLRAPFRMSRNAGLTWGLLVLAAFSVVPSAGGDVSRHAAAVLPIAYLLAVEAVWRGSRTRPGLVAALLLIVAQPAWTWVKSDSDSHAGYALLGQWLRTHALPGTVVGARHVGALGYYSGLQMEDVLGRVSPRVAAARHLQPAASSDSANADFGPMLRQEPDLVLVGEREPVPPSALYVPNDEAVPPPIRGTYSLYRWAGSPVWRSTPQMSIQMPERNRGRTAVASTHGGSNQARPTQKEGEAAQRRDGS